MNSRNAYLILTLGTAFSLCALHCPDGTDATDPSKTSPTKGSTVPAGQVLTFDKVSIGDGQVCAIAREDKSLWCWGNNEAHESPTGGKTTGFLGVGKKEQLILKPTKVPASHGWSDVSVGEREIIMALDETGLVYGWGRNVGQMGFAPWPGILGVQSDKLPKDQDKVITTPTLITKDHSFQRVWAGQANFALSKTGALWGWGSNAKSSGFGTVVKGTLAVGAKDDVVGQPKAVVGSHDWISYSGNTGSFFGVDKNGDLWFWGDVSSNQITSCIAARLQKKGVAPNSLVSMPMKISEATDPKWSRMYYPQSRLCALDQKNHAHCWGTNPDGALGVGSPEATVLVPTPVTGNHAWAQFSATYSARAGIDQSGTLYLWGDNKTDLGVGAKTDVVSKPTQLLGDKKWLQVEIGSFGGNFIAIDDAHHLYYWGRNAHGEAGLGHTKPVAVPTLIEVHALAAGAD